MTTSVVPVCVSFSGVDGAGKSTQIERLVRELSPQHTVEVLWNPLTFWPQAALGRLPKGVRSRLGSGGARGGRAGSGSTPEAAGRSAPLTRALWVLVGTFAAVSSSLSLRRRVGATTADVLILDRFRLDTLVKLQYWYPDVPRRWLARLVLSLAPTPPVELLIRVSPEDAHARKAEEWSILELSVHARLYDEAADRARATVLDGARDAASLGDDIVERVRTVLDG